METREAPSHRFFGFFALIGFALSLLAHIAAVCGVDVSSRWPFVWALHVGAFVVFIPFLISARKTLGPKGGWGSRFDLTRLREVLPARLSVVCAVLFVYVFINFFASTSLLGNGSPEARDGKFVLQSKGHLIREITESEYHQYNSYTIRAFSGHWLLFYFLPFAYFLFRKPALPGVSDKQPSEDEYADPDT